MSMQFLRGFDLTEPSLLSLGGTPALPARVDTPIELSGVDLRRFEYRFFEAFSSAQVEMQTIHDRARRNQAVYEMVKRISPIDGSSQYTTPMSRNTANGVVAHIKDAIEQPQLFSFKARSVGRIAAEATQTANLCAALLERELETGGSRAVITSDVIRSAVFMGTAPTALKLSNQGLRDEEQFFYFDEPIPLTSFFTDRVSTRNLWETTCFYYDKQRMYTIEEMALAGIFDQDVVEQMINNHIWEARSFQEDLLDFNEQHRFAAENSLVTLLYGYMRFRPEGSRVAKLYEGIADVSNRRFLSLRENPFGEAFDSPPINLWRIGTMPNSLYGNGIIERLSTTQDMMDRETNNYFSFSDKMAAPPFVYREGSWIGKRIKSHGQAGIHAGMGIPSKFGDLNDVQFIDWKGNPSVSFGSMQIIEKFKQDATFTNEALSNTDSRKTLGQTQIESQRGTLNLRVDLTDLALDGHIAGEMFWRAIVAYKIKRKGVVSVYKGGKLLSYDKIKTTELNQLARELIYSKLLSRQISPQEAADFQAEFMSRLTQGRIPYVNRLDLAVSLTGTKIISDKMSELGMLERLTPFITSLLQGAEQNSYINYHMRQIMLTMGLNDTDLRMPPDPNEVQMTPEQYQAITANFNEIQKASSLI